MPSLMLDEIRAIVLDQAARPGALLPILHAVQERFGFIADDVIPIIADGLNLSRAEVHGVVSFYNDFRRSPLERPVIKLCHAEACKARGMERVAVALEKVPEVEVERVFCLGLCASGPAALVGEAVHARLDEASALSLARSLTR